MRCVHKTVTKKGLSNKPKFQFARKNNAVRKRGCDEYLIVITNCDNFQEMKNRYKLQVACKFCIFINAQLALNRN